MGDHAVVGTQAVGQRLPAAQEELLYLDAVEGASFHMLQELRHLQDRRQEKAENSARTHCPDGLVETLPGSAHVEEEGVCALDAEAIPHVAAMDLDVCPKLGPFEVAAGELDELFSGVVAHDAARGAGEPGERAGEAA